jgi:ubiquinone biosynthesis protein
MVVRLGAIAAIAGSEAARTLPAALAIRICRGRTASQEHAYRGLVRGLQALGPTFVKGGQIFAPRADALPAVLCAELSRLHDAVAPMSRARTERALRAARAAQPALEQVDIDLEPVGSGSIACVYRGELRDGEAVALKLKRPGIDRRMQADLALVVAMARAGQHLPKLRGMPIADLLEYLSRAVLGQLDFEREARHMTQIRERLRSNPDVFVPAVRPELSAPNCLAFDYVPGLDAKMFERISNIARSWLAMVTLEAVHTLFFEDGLVHCDLHPGSQTATAAAAARSS